MFCCTFDPNSQESNLIALFGMNQMFLNVAFNSSQTLFYLINNPPITLHFISDLGSRDVPRAHHHSIVIKLIYFRVLDPSMLSGDVHLAF